MKPIAGVLTALGAVLVFALAGGAGTANAETITFVVEATGDHVVPGPVSTADVASAEFRFNNETNELTYTVKVLGLRDYEVSGAALHHGAVGENGPVAYTLSDEGFVLATGTLSLSDADVAALMAGELYLNVTSPDYPDGFARGQLIPPGGVVPAETSEVLGAVDIQPPATGDAGLADRSGSTSWLPAALLLTLAAAGAGVVAIRSRV
jgi:hypothetical protein